MPRDRLYSDRSPLRQMMDTTGLRSVDIAARAGCTMQVVGKAIAGDNYRMPIDSLVRVALALGCAPIELMPQLARRPRKGLLHEVGYYRSQHKGRMAVVNDREDFGD